MLKRAARSDVRHEAAEINRPVFIVCEKEKRVREHRYSWTRHHKEPGNPGMTKPHHVSYLMFACQMCKHERVYGIED